MSVKRIMSMPSGVALKPRSRRGRPATARARARLLQNVRGRGGTLAFPARAAAGAETRAAAGAETRAAADAETRAAADAETRAAAGGATRAAADAPPAPRGRRRGEGFGFGLKFRVSVLG